MKWSDIPTAAKMATSSVVVIMAAVGYLTTFQTDAEAAEMEQRVTKKLDQIRIDDLEAQIALYEFQKLSDDLSPPKIEWLDKQIEKLEKKKAKLEEAKEKADDA